MNKTAQEISALSKKKVRTNENLRKIWQEIDGSIVYYVEIGIKGDCPNAKIEDRDGIAYKKQKTAWFLHTEKP
jgi:hypothetical protein